MEDIRSITEISRQENLDEIMKDYDNLELYQLAMYLAGAFLDTPPNEKQQQFIRDVFGEHGWAEFVNNEKRRRRLNPPFFVMRPHFDLDAIRGIVMFELTKRFSKLMLTHSKLELKLAKMEESKTNLMLDLGVAIVNSHDESGVFWKDDGWINISEALLKHKLIELD